MHRRADARPGWGASRSGRRGTKEGRQPASGSPLGGLTSRFGGGDKKDEKKDNKRVAVRSVA